MAPPFSHVKPSARATSQSIRNRCSVTLVFNQASYYAALKHIMQADREPERVLSELKRLSLSVQGD
ncbi:hypothetical protein [Nostoc sp.]|uniref:hypothetical protein n=1 Tax=Nostoc sp. TaxID=1180 RepID=UPI003FA5FFF5